MLNSIICGDRMLGAGPIRDMIASAANGLLAMGIAPGDRVAILMRNEIESVVATAAIQHVGAYSVQINWHSHPEEAAYVIADSGARLLIGHRDLLAAANPHLPPRLALIEVPVSPTIVAAYGASAGRAELPFGHGATLWDDWLAAQSATAPDASMAAETIIYTSGTSGRPKGVIRAAASGDLAQRSETMRQTVFDIGPGARVLVPAPIYHTAPHLFALRALRQADLLVLMTRFDAAQFLELVARHGITHAYLVAPLFQRLLQLSDAEWARHDLSSLRFVLHAGSPCPVALKAQAIDRMGPIINEYYGSTETGPNTFCNSHDWLAHPGTAGRPVPGVDIRFVDDAGHDVAQGNPGEIIVRNNNYTDFTYIGLPQERQALDRDGYVATGDIGYQTAEGFVFICDRKRDLVISGGVNIYPAEIEAALQAMPGIQDCAVFGIPDTNFGEALAAHVQAAPGAIGINADTVRRHLSARIASFKVPRVIEFCDSLPRDDAGKIRKRVLRQPYWENAGRQI